jgi:UTP--glucose-1-phosphate uridylyltransferase
VDNEPFAVILPDDLILARTPCMKQLVDAHTAVGGNIVAVADVPRDQTNRYGILDVLTDDGRLARAKGLVEKPEPAKAPSTLSIIGRYILHPRVFDFLDKQVKGAGNEIQLTDAIAKTIDSVPFHGLRFTGRRFDCGDKVGWLHANLSFALDRPDMHDQVAEVLKEFK